MTSNEKYVIQSNDTGEYLYEACAKGHEAIEKKKLNAYGADVNQEDKYNCTPLIQACLILFPFKWSMSDLKCKNEAVIKYLVEHGSGYQSYLSI
ncbi:hypothetical protein H8356DRAFT_1359171 [Neocallimastix lanati (nom. inval.)]|nr:hypothetical protein H8356DRAFT_1359171 [Neocallimastix sp. JGI-2020a]